MAICNFDKKEIHCKIFYFGIAGAGKTENLRALYRATAPQMKSDMFELEADKRPNPLFDFLPLKLGAINGYQVRLHAFTLPPPYFAEAFDILLKGVDGFVFVIDSELTALPHNTAAWQQTLAMLEGSGYIVEDLPQVYQYNRRDALQPVAIEILQETFNPRAHPHYEAIARRGIGTLECLHKLAQLVVAKMLNS